MGLGDCLLYPGVTVDKKKSRVVPRGQNRGVKVVVVVCMCPMYIVLGCPRVCLGWGPDQVVIALTTLAWGENKGLGDCGEGDDYARGERVNGILGWCFVKEGEWIETDKRENGERVS